MCINLIRQSNSEALVEHMAGTACLPYMQMKTALKKDMLVTLLCILYHTDHLVTSPKNKQWKPQNADILGT